jgi:F0F1-type ATP synthase assembly protein I
MNGAVIRQALRILLWQVMGLLLMVSVAGFWQGPQIALAVLAGAMIGLVTTAYLVFVLIKHALQPVRPATVLSLFGNWLLKVLLTVGLLVVALRIRALAPGAILTGLAGSLLAYWLAMMIKRDALGSK